MSDKRKDKADYDKEPVYYCKRCLSLRIRTMRGVGDYCDSCGSLAIDTTSIHEHERMVRERVNRMKDGQRD